MEWTCSSASREIAPSLILERAGFVQVNRRDFGPALDSESRRIGTLYMKARKPDRFQAA